MTNPCDSGTADMFFGNIIKLTELTLVSAASIAAFVLLYLFIFSIIGCMRKAK